MHCELLVPGLLAQTPAGPDGMPRMPALERLLARARTSESAPATPEDWLAQSMGLEAGHLPAGALARAAGSPSLPVPGEHWIRIDPVHLKLGRESLTLLPAALLDLRADEAATLCASLASHFGDLFSDGPAPADAQSWYARLRHPVEAGRAPAIALCGADVDAQLQTGRMPAPWHAFLNEAQMLLHTHPVNEAREARGELPVNSVWPWGAGDLPNEVLPWRTISGTDPTAIGLARACALPDASLPAHAPAWLAACGDTGRHLAWLDMLRAPACLGEHERWIELCARLERDWFAPLTAALQDGRIGMISMHVPDARGCLSFELTRGDLRRFWRRTRPLAHYMRTADER